MSAIQADIIFWFSWLFQAAAAFNRVEEVALMIEEAKGKKKACGSMFLLYLFLAGVSLMSAVAHDCNLCTIVLLFRC